MPIQMWTRDQRPELMLAGGDALARGIAGGVGNLSKALEEVGKQHKRESQEAQAIRTMLGDDPNLKDRLKAMGIGELRGHLQKRTLDQVIKQQQEEAALRRQEMDIRLQEYAARAMDRSREEAFNRELSGMGKVQFDSPEMGDYYENPEKYDTQNYHPQPMDLSQAIELMPHSPQPMSPQDRAESIQRLPFNPQAPTSRTPGLAEVLAAAGRHGQLLNPRLDNLSRAIAMENRSAGGGPLSFEEDPATGARFARGGNTILPSGTNPAKMNTGGQEIYDADGNLLGHNVPTGGGKFAFRPLRPKVNGQLEKVLDPMTGQPVPGMGMDATGKVHDWRDKMTKEGVAQFFNKSGAAAPSKPRKWNPKTKQLEEQ